MPELSVQLPEIDILRQVTEFSVIGTLIVDARHPEQPVVYVNPAFERQTGYAAAEVLGRNCRFLQGQDRDQAGVHALRRAIAAGQVVTVTLRNYRKDGSLFYNEVTVQPVYDAGGTITYLVGYQNDVTAREESYRHAVEAKLASLLERVTDGFFSFDQALTLTYINATAASISGRRPADLIGCNLRETFPEVTGSALVQAVHQAQATGTVQIAESYLAPYGKWIDARIYPAEDGISVFIRDITKEKQVQRTLEDSEERSRRIAAELQRTLDLSMDLIASVDADGRFVTASAACQRLLGYAPDELIGRSFLAFLHPQDRDRTLREGERVLAGRARVPFQNRYLHKNGSVVWMEWTSAVLPGDPLTYCVARDITQRRAAEEDQAHLAAIVQASHDVIIGVTLDGLIRSWNAGAEETYGYSAEEAVGQPISLIVPPAFLAEQTEILRRAGQGQRVRSFESIRCHKDGRHLPVSITASPILDVSGQVVGVSAVAQDISARRAAEAQIQQLNEHLKRQLRQLTGLRMIDQAIASSVDLSVTLGMILDNIQQQLEADAVTVLVLNPHTLTLEYAGTRGFTARLRGPALRLSTGLAGEVALRREALCVPDLRRISLTPSWRKVLTGERLTAYYGAPLMAKGKVVGVIEVLHRTPFEPALPWLEVFDLLASQAAIAVDNAQLLAELEQKNLDLRLAYEETIEGWARALDLRDKETEGHSRRVTEMTVALCQALGVSAEKLVDVRRGALLHDIGKMAIPDAVLLKPGGLTEDEWAQMKKHPEYAVHLLSPIRFLRPALDIPQYHHEQWDGRGYPNGLQGTAIPLTARAFAVVDVYDALTSDRPYRTAWSRDAAMAYNQAAAGTHFDPQVVQVFVDLMRRGPPYGEEEP
ncbi:PAS domain S-box protein (plasmid) [Deinococcus taeanensis]|uniref:PAS domain S-box protein n=1 Tax=Deinococcus taeanensis TaxID=2737050 RepID=UPI001CDB8F2C|nr:PAS domain S-box protein [Deinococcus taeanensis]UBV44612.1 PAS domain S-box protein [Deinococcus taeanensis]